MKRFSPLALLSLFVLSIATVRAAGTPEEVAQSYFERLQAGQIAESCELFAPSAVEEIAALIDLMADAAEESGEGAELKQFFGKKVTPESLKKMKPMKKFQKFMTGVMKMIGEVEFSEFKVIGSVPEGDDLSHVVVRMKMVVQGIEVEAVDVAPMQKTGDQWGMLLQAEMSAMVQAMRAMYEAEE